MEGEALLRIKHERLRRNWSQTALAFHARMSVGDVGRIESGRFRPYNSQVEKLAAVLGLSPDALLQEVTADQAETVQRSAALPKRDTDLGLLAPVSA